MKKLILVAVLVSANSAHAFVSGDEGNGFVTTNATGSVANRDGVNSGSKGSLTTRSDMQILAEAKVDATDYLNNGVV